MITEKVFEFKDGRVKEFLGDIDDYLETRKASDFRAIEKKQQNTKDANLPKQEKSAPDYQQQKRIKSLKNKLGSIEKKINALEEEIAVLDHKLLMEYEQTVADPKFFDGYHGKKETLNTLMEDWERISEELDTSL